MKWKKNWKKKMCFLEILFPKNNRNMDATPIVVVNGVPLIIQIGGIHKERKLDV